MKYLKSYEFLKKKERYSIDHLFEDVDATKIKINISNDYKILEYKKDNTNYKIAISETSNREVGSIIRIMFYVNDEFKKAPISKLRKLYNFLLREYEYFHKEVNKYNL